DQTAHSDHRKVRESIHDPGIIRIGVCLDQFVELLTDKCLVQINVLGRRDLGAQGNGLPSAPHELGHGSGDVGVRHFLTFRSSFSVLARSATNSIVSMVPWTNGGGHTLTWYSLSTTPYMLLSITSSPRVVRRSSPRPPAGSVPMPPPGAL